jgi:dCMP deaminase
MRPTWDATWMEMAEVIARRSLCSRAKHGAVIVSPSNRAVGLGYNGPPAGFDHHDEPCSRWCERGKYGPAEVREYQDCPSVHAEANALLNTVAPINGAMLYVNGTCCMDCAKLVANSGISTVFMRARADEGHRRPADVVGFLERCGITTYWLR